MADLKLNITGDSSSGQAAMEDMGEAVGKSAVKWQEMANAAKFAAKEIAAFLIDSTRKYAESERNLRQLQRAAHEYTQVIADQAKALSELYAVDDDLIIQSSTLLAQWGGAAAASKRAEEAALNLAAAMGTDLRSATEMLIKNVESGGVGLAKMGIHFEATGKKGKDLEAAINAINAKLGGAAAADAASLTGRLHGAQLAFEDLQKSMGGMLGDALSKSGALDFITTKIREMTKGLEIAVDLFPKLFRLASGVLRGNVDVDTALEEAKNATYAAGMTPYATPTAVPDKVDDEETNQRKKKAAQEAARAAREAAKEEANIRREMAEADAREQKELQKRELDAQDDYAKESIKIEKERLSEIAKAQKAESAAEEKAKKERLAAELKTQKEAAQEEEKALKEQQERVKKKAEEARHAGDMIGAAMVNALADQLSKLAEGGEFDAALFIGDILAAAVGVAGTVIGTAFGAPAVGAALGNLAAMGIRAGSSAISKGNKGNKPRTMHDGGWVDAPRFHDGTWIAPDEQRAILQTGERVLSRREVHHMGGAGAVDNMARGSGGGRPIYIQAIDTKSFADTMSSNGGDGLKQAIKRGHGALPSLFGSPR